MGSRDPRESGNKSKGSLGAPTDKVAVSGGGVLDFRRIPFVRVDSKRGNGSKTVGDSEEPIANRYEHA